MYSYIPVFLQLASFQVANVVELAIDNLIILCPSSHDQLLTLAAACWILYFYKVLLHFSKFSLFVFFSFDPWPFFCLSCFCHCIMLMLAANPTAYMSFGSSSGMQGVIIRSHIVDFFPPMHCHGIRDSFPPKRCHRNTSPFPQDSRSIVL